MTGHWKLECTQSGLNVDKVVGRCLSLRYVPLPLHLDRVLSLLRLFNQYLRQNIASKVSVIAAA